MSAPKCFFERFRIDEDGASFLEYTALLGVLFGTALIVFSNVGGYANTMWESLANALGIATG
jgi:Flp pilus assembly pilin Flp